MKKKIDVADLDIGMYVSELDRSWIGTPFLFQGFEIRTSEEIAQLQGLCKHVVIDVSQGRDVRPRAKRAAAAPAAPAAAPGRRPPRYADQRTLEEELQQARELQQESRQATLQIMEDVRLGRSIDSEGAKKVVAGMVESVIRNPDALVVLNLLKKRDEYTVMHCLRVCIMALAFGRHMEFSEEDLNLLGLGALLHDVGKMRVPNEVLNKPGRLTPEEFELMKSHVPHGVTILEHTKGIPSVAIDVARFHHERYDGTGYAQGRKADQIGLFGGMSAVVDVYDAISSDRVYHMGKSSHDTLKILYEARGTHFFPHLAEQFIQCVGIYPIGSLVEMSPGSIGVVITVDRERQLRPRVAMVLNPDKQPYVPVKIIDLMNYPDAGPGSIKITKILPSGTHGIHPMDYVIPLAGELALPPGVAAALDQPGARHGKA